jgi:hypothetical protein
VPRTISSAQTLVMKFVVPVLWIGVFGFGTAMLFRTGDALGQRPPPPDMKWLFLAGLVVGSIAMYPKPRPFAFFSSHPIVVELRAAADAAKPAPGRVT